MNKFKRVFFLILYYGFARHLPVSYFPGGAVFKGIRYQICRRLFEYCGRNVNIEKGASFHSGRNVFIGDNSGIGINAELNGEVRIGENVMMGPNCLILTRNHKFDRTDIPMCEQHFTEDKPVLIKDDVWIGQNVILLPGVTLGRGCVIGAGAVVPKSIPEYAVAVGNPAKVVKYRDGRKEGDKPRTAKKQSAETTEETAKPQAVMQGQASLIAKAFAASQKDAPEKSPE